MHSKPFALFPFTPELLNPDKSRQLIPSYLYAFFNHKLLLFTKSSANSCPKLNIASIRTFMSRCQELICGNPYMYYYNTICQSTMITQFSRGYKSFHSRQNYSTSKSTKIYLLNPDGNDNGCPSLNIASIRTSRSRCQELICDNPFMYYSG